MSRHVTERIQHFIDRELPDEERASVGEHLINCADCRLEHDRLRAGAGLAAHLESDDAPPRVWEGIRSGLQAPEKGPSGFRYRNHVLAFGIAVFAMLLFIPAFVYLSQEGVDPAPAAISDWRLEETKGDPSVTGLGDEGRLAVGSVLETGDGSTARLAVGRIGRVDVAPNSKVKLVRSSETEQRMALERGKMSAEIIAPPRLFIVDTPSSAAVDLGCAYTLEVDEEGSSRLHVTGGYVALERDGLESYVPAGAYCESRKGRKLGTPFFGSASVKLKRSLAEFDFGAGGYGLIDIIIAESKKKDTLTLWHLISRAPQEKRAEIVAKILEFVEPSPSVTIGGLLDLDKKMLEELKSDLEPIWYEQPGWFDNP